MAKFRFFRIGWSEEGIMWRRGSFEILKPRGKCTAWRLRKVYGKDGRQVEEMEGDFTTERKAFKYGNWAVRRDKKKEKIYTRAVRLANKK